MHNKYLRFLTEEIHSVVVATIDEQGNPVSCVMDMMLCDEQGLYFLTAKGKSLYQRLVQHPTIALTGFRGKDTMSSQSLSLQGKVAEVGRGLLDEIFRKNDYMENIYPGEESRSALTVFHIYQGSGEFFDLSVQPIFRECFSWGGVERKQRGYHIGAGCNGCQQCVQVCPQNCIDRSEGHAIILQQHCLHCGNCFRICPQQAVQLVDR